MAVDDNQITMEVLTKTAEKHGLACLLYEKPFEGINGSGKHNNWSIVTDDGQNLFSPGEKPAENIRFLLFVCAFIRAVDENAVLLRMSASSAGNDHRLGADEAPPAIISIYLGSYIEQILYGLYLSGGRRGRGRGGAGSTSRLPRDGRRGGRVRGPGEGRGTRGRPKPERATDAQIGRAHV